MEEVATFLTKNLATLVAAAVVCIFTGLIAWLQSRSQAEGLIVSLREHLAHAKRQLGEESQRQGSLERDLQVARQENKALATKVAKFESVRAKLRESCVVKTHLQPVILAGPRGVGKTSLLMQWYAPWVSGNLSATTNHFTAEVPVHDFDQSDEEPHFADPEIRVPVEVHLGLKVHDFPGEPQAQALIRQVVAQETAAVREITNKDVGVVLICMFDASQAATGISKEAQEYYNGDLFRELRTLVSHRLVSITRLILVFNKYDLLKPHFSTGMAEIGILEHCVRKFEPLLLPLRGICNPEKVCEVFTIVPREEMHFKNQGAIIVKAEAARVFVEMFVGRQIAEELLPQKASSIAAGKLGL